MFRLAQKGIGEKRLSGDYAAYSPGDHYALLEHGKDLAVYKRKPN